MNKGRIILFFSIVILFATGCTNEQNTDKKIRENKLSEPAVTSTVEESDNLPTGDLSIFSGEWLSPTNQISIVLKNEEQQQIEVETHYMVGGEMFLTDYDQQKNSYTFESKKEFISFQVLNEHAAIIWYGTTEAETTGVSAPIEYTKNEI